MKACMCAIVALVLGLPGMTLAQTTPKSTATTGTPAEPAAVGIDVDTTAPLMRPRAKGIEYVIVELIAKPAYNYQEYLGKHLRYPVEAVNNKVQGIVFVNFQVDTLGLIRDVKLTKGLTPELNKEALRVVSHMPPWKPAMQAGKPIIQRMQLPVQFKLEAK